MNEELWKSENYEKFLEIRRETIAEMINEYLDSLIMEQEEVRKKSIEIITLVKVFWSSKVRLMGWRENKLNKTSGILY